MKVGFTLKILKGIYLNKYLNMCGNVNKNYNYYTRGHRMYVLSLIYLGIDFNILH